MTAAIAGGTKIEWADYSWNPWWGCERVSPACAHCYADTFARRVGQKDLWTKTGEHGFRWLSDANWAKPLKWARTAPAKLGRRPRVFCASMADVFEEHPRLEEPRRRLFHLIADTPELDWLVLTKRPEVARDWLGYWYALGGPTGVGPLKNVWLGTSIENARFTWRADALREIPAAVRFISAEPLLGSLYPKGDTNGSDQPHHRGSVDGRPGEGVAGDRRRGGTAQADARDVRGGAEGRGRAQLDLSGIDWVITGAESGHRARPMNHDHVRELRDACAVSGAAFFYKQDADARGRKIGTPELDGRQWMEFPRA